MHTLHKTAVTIAIGCLAISGCAIQLPSMGSAYNEQLPENWQSLSERGLVDDNWWLTFDDGRLSALIIKAADKNPALLQAAARSEQARAQAGITGADRLPSLSAMLNATKQEQPLTTLGETRRITSESYGASLNVNW